MKQEFYSNGKLLLSSEYAILDGAQGLAIPTKYGQSLAIKSIEKPVLDWKSIADYGTIWFEAEFAINNFVINHATNSETANTLQKILVEAKRQNSNFLTKETGIEAISHLTFPREWGLGSSSTLINNIAQWANVDAYQLLWNAFGGSGYDIACAQHDFPITYTLKNRLPQVAQAEFNPPFKDSLYFVYLNEKQNSKKAIEAYRKQAFNKEQLVNHLSSITQKMIQTNSLVEFEALIEEHEAILSEVLGLQPVKSRLFQDYNGAIKSLGAWGGDFVLVTSRTDPSDYFREMKFKTLVKFEDMIL
ncbi:MAG: GYDIA family GHMP kinase [Bacteroidota bacterium]